MKKNISTENVICGTYVNDIKFRAEKRAFHFNISGKEKKTFRKKAEAEILCIVKISHIILTLFVQPFVHVIYGIAQLTMIINERLTLK
jgi:uncharacterized ion transporter superfamily protein YfcC